MKKFLLSLATAFSFPSSKIFGWGKKKEGKFLPCLQKNLLENPHIFPTNTSSKNGSWNVFVPAAIPYLLDASRCFKMKS